MTPWLLAGLVGASASFAVWPWPALRFRIWTGLIAVIAGLGGLVLWWQGVEQGWGLSVGWYGAFVAYSVAGRMSVPGYGPRLRWSAILLMLLVTGWGMWE